jgi:hypothetical protein
VNHRTDLLVVNLAICVFWAASSAGGRNAEAWQVVDQRKDVRVTYEMDGEHLRKLRLHVSALRLGESMHNVTTSIGRPDREDRTGPKRGDWKCRELVYFVRIIGEEPGNVNDKLVRLIFDRHNARLTAIRSDVDGISSRGDVNACR